MLNRVVNSVTDWRSTINLSCDLKPITSFLGITFFVVVQIFYSEQNVKNIYVYKF